MNYHSDSWIMKNVLEHLDESKEFFPEEQIVGLFYYGSGNYGLDTENSNVDTKLVVAPSLKDIALNKKPINTIHIRDNEEHIDFKDVRLMLQVFRKQAINFIETLFTDYKWINPPYKSEWMRLVDNRETIARYNPFAMVKSIKSMAAVEFHALEHEYPSGVGTFKKFSYNPERLRNLLCLHVFLNKYIAGESYEKCLRTGNESVDDFLELTKQNFEVARSMAKSSIDYIIKTANEYCANIKNEGNIEVEELLEDVQCNIVKIALQSELIDK